MAARFVRWPTSILAARKKDGENTGSQPVLIQILGRIGQVFIAITLGALFAGVLSAALAALSSGWHSSSTSSSRLFPDLPAMNTPNTEVESLLSIEIGTIHTRALLFDLVDGQYRFLGASRVAEHTQRAIL